MQVTKIKQQTNEIQEIGLENVELKEQLRVATQMVNQVMEQEGSVLQRFHIKYKDIVMGKQLGMCLTNSVCVAVRVCSSGACCYTSSLFFIGEGGFGTVVKGVLRGELDVAVKTMRVTKITKHGSNQGQGFPSPWGVDSLD